MDWFDIEWFGPYAIDTAHERKVAQNYGIYAIFAKKGATNKLLYIGRTYWQEFRKRLRQHKRDWLDRVTGTITVHFGIVKLAERRKISYYKVSDIEKCLIHSELPPYNTASKKGYCGRDILILNTGKRGNLSKIVTDDSQLLRLLKKAFSK